MDQLRFTETSIPSFVSAIRSASFHEPGSRLPLHHHIGDEVIFLIEGSHADEAGEVLTGNVNHRVPGTIHSVTSKNGGTVLSMVTGDVEMLE